MESESGEPGREDGEENGVVGMSIEDGNAVVVSQGMSVKCESGCNYIICNIYATGW